MQYLSPNVEVTLCSEDGTTYHKFYPSKKYQLDAYNHAVVYLKTNEYPEHRFVFDLQSFSQAWSNTTSSNLDIG